MSIKYYEDDDILVQRFSNNPIVREVSQGWNINTSYDKDGHIVQIVILEAKEKGLYPIIPMKMAA
jgi:carotenoid cleavage dioxygenase-like enzyme